MENSFQTSFIPKKTDILNSSRKEPKSPFFLISIFLLIVSVLIFGGLFFYKNYLKKQKVTVSASLSAIRSDFDKETIDELTVFNNKIETAKSLLSKHTVVSSFFDLLAEITVPSIQYTSFNYENNGDIYKIKLNGIASDYITIIHQSDVFNSSKGQSFSNVVFSNLSKDKSNNITFGLEFDVSPGVFSYENNNINSQ